MITKDNWRKWDGFFQITLEKKPSVPYECPLFLRINPHVFGEFLQFLVIITVVWGTNLLSDSIYLLVDYCMPDYLDEVSGQNRVVYWRICEQVIWTIDRYIDR